ncbi:14397_t:CDS:2, partial [Racocetra fulgida]
NLETSRALGDFEFKQNPKLFPQEQLVTGKTCEDLVDYCLARDSVGIGSYNNMTVIVAGFLHKRTETEWYEWIAKRYEEKGSEFKW